jgi:hypothetical protein
MDPSSPTSMAAYERQLKHEAAERKQKKQSDQAMFLVTLASTLVAVFAAIAAFWSVYEAHQTRITDERPFLAVDFTQDNAKTSEQGEAGLFPPFHMSLVAFGKTPAKRVMVRCEMQIDDKKTMVWDDKYGYKRFAYPYILPSRSVNMFCPLKEPSQSQTSATIKNYVILGVATYEDETRRKYVTPFCEEIFMLYGKIEGIGPCERDVRLPELK